MNPKKKLAEICKDLHDAKLVSGSDGNLSFRLDEKKILTTPSKINKKNINIDNILTIDYKGSLIEGEGKVTSEAKMHTLIYKLRPEINAIIHTHAPYCTAFAACGLNIPDNILIEIPIIIGRTAVADFAPPGTDELVKSIEPLVKENNAILLSNHGVIVVGKDLDEAYDRLESLESAAKAIILSKLIGKSSTIPNDIVDKMFSKTK